MFSPATKRPNLGARRDRSSSYGVPGSPATLATDHIPQSSSSIVPNRPDFGTPMPKSSRLSFLSRIQKTEKTETKTGDDRIHPVHVGDFPQALRSAQANLLKKGITDHGGISGGMDRPTCLCWMIYGGQVFIWSYISSVGAQKCVVLALPSPFSETVDSSTTSWPSNNWLLCFVKWDKESESKEVLERQCPSVGIVLFSKKRQAIAYWHNIYSKPNEVVTCLLNVHEQTHQEATMRQHMKGSLSSGSHLCEFNSLIVSSIPDSVSHECVAFASHSSGELWLFRCTPAGVFHTNVFKVFSTEAHGVIGDAAFSLTGQYVRSLRWRFQDISLNEEHTREFFVLTNQEIQCWNVILAGEENVSKLWSHEIIGTDRDSVIKKDQSSQKQTLLLDIQVDDSGKELTILVATICKDIENSSSYVQYLLQRMQYRSGDIFMENSVLSTEKVLEKKAPIQMILPKARMEEEEFLFAMQLHVGGKPPGSAMILSRDGTATVAHFRGEAAHLYQFDLPGNAGKVIDSSVLPSMENMWVVLTENAGIWAIPVKVILLGGVEPPDQNLSARDSLNDATHPEVKRSHGFGVSIFPRNESFGACDIDDTQRTQSTGIVPQSTQDEQAEALVLRLFHDFIYSGRVEGVFEKLKGSGAFDKDGEENIFARASKSIVDALAKHWTTTRGTEIVALAVVSSQLLEKQQKHEKYLHFLALSKCHEELSFSQRQTLQIILEHGEKLASMIRLRGLQNALSQKTSMDGSASSEMSSSVWDLIQLVGEKARMGNVLLLDRETLEIFCSKVSEIEEMFSCIHNYLSYIIVGQHPNVLQLRRACEISKACTVVVNAAIDYRNEHSTWYPSSDGLCPWHCKPIVRSGLWSIASLFVDLLKESQALELKMDLVIHLEELTDALLEGYANSIAVKIEKEEDCRVLQMEYGARRDALLGSLYRHMKDLAEAKYQESRSTSEDSDIKNSLLKEFYGHLIEIARRHAGYQTLWDICYDLNDTGLLRTLMCQSMGLEEGRFSNFVFKKLHEKQQYSKILRLGEEFQEDLASFLKRHMDLLWLHQIFLNRFSSASDTLHTLALFNDDTHLKETVQSFGSKNTRYDLSLLDRRRLLNLSKISASAGHDPDFVKIKRIEADLHILTVQEEVQEVFDCGNQLIPPAELIKICLKSQKPELILRTFDVFAWTSSDFRMRNRTLLAECWMFTAKLDDWAMVYKQSVSEEWSDDKRLEVLQRTGLFQASHRCYGPDAQLYEGSFEVLPLLQTDVLGGEDSYSSVEAILAEHPDFPEAGKLMISAIVIGADGEGVEIEGNSPMTS